MLVVERFDLVVDVIWLIAHGDSRNAGQVDQGQVWCIRHADPQLQRRVNHAFVCSRHILSSFRHKGLDFVPMRLGLLLPIPVAIVLGSLCLPPPSDSSFVFVLVVTVFQLIRVVGEIEYHA